MAMELDDDSLDSIHYARTALKNIQLETFAVDLEEPNWIRRQRAIQSDSIHQERRVVPTAAGGSCARPSRHVMQDVGVACPDCCASERDVRISLRCNIPLQQAEGDGFGSYDSTLSRGDLLAAAMVKSPIPAPTSTTTPSSAFNSASP